MGRTAVPIVAANLTIVRAPGQGVYVRSKHNIVRSARLIRFQHCVGKKMRGAHGDRAAVQAAFKSAAQSCRGA
jgi:hypothetical protein